MDVNLSQRIINILKDIIETKKIYLLKLMKIPLGVNVCFLYYLKLKILLMSMKKPNNLKSYKS